MRLRGAAAGPAHRHAGDARATATRVAYALTWRHPPGVVAAACRTCRRSSRSAPASTRVRRPAPAGGADRARRRSRSDRADERMGRDAGAAASPSVPPLRPPAAPRNWDEDEAQPAARDVRVGLLGLGVLGLDAARKLQALGFDVAGWSRSPKTRRRRSRPSTATTVSTRCWRAPTFSSRCCR